MMKDCGLIKHQRERSACLVDEVIHKKRMKGAVFREFMSQRLPTETSPVYVEEWADRFMSGDPVLYMDDTSKRAYFRALKKVHRVG